MRSIAIGILILSILGGAVYLSQPYWDKDRVAFLWQDEPEQIVKEDINILVLGRVAEGQGGRWHAAPGLVDAIVILNYKPDEKIVNLVSLPRDLYAEVGGEEFKINRIYQRGKINEFLEKATQITGIPVDKYLVVDVAIIEKAVDELGGIDVVLQEDVVDGVSGFRLLKGEQHITGVDTVWIIRNRYSKDGDFFRERNQHIIIEGIFAKFNKLNTVQKTKFLFNIVPFIRDAETNFSIGEVIPEFNKVGDLRFNSVVLGFDTGLLKSSYIPVNASSSAYVLIPTEGMDEYGDIQEFITSELLK